MNKEIIRRINGSDIKIVIRDNYVHIEDVWNAFDGRFRLDDMDNFIVWLNHCLNTNINVERCLDLNRRFFKFPSEVSGNHIAKERIPYIKNILRGIDNKLYKTILDIKDNTELLKEILNHASLWELDDVYSKIKTKKGELQ